MTTKIQLQKVKRMKLADYEVFQTLGAGSFGRVKLAKNKITNKFVALKQLKKAEIIRLKQVDHLVNESTILSNMEHPFIVEMDGFCQDERFLYLVLEFIAGGELFTYLRKIGKLTAAHAAYYGAQVACMFEYLHSMNILYR